MCDKLTRPRVPVAAATPNGVIAFELPADHRLMRIIIKETAGNAITGLSLGFESEGTGILNAYDLAANKTYDFIVNTSTGAAFDWANASKIYISASAWNSGAVSLMPYYTEI